MSANQRSVAQNRRPFSDEEPSYGSGLSFCLLLQTSHCSEAVQLRGACFFRFPRLSPFFGHSLPYSALPLFPSFLLFRPGTSSLLLPFSLVSVVLFRLLWLCPSPHFDRAARRETGERPGVSLPPPRCAIASVNFRERKG